MEPARVADSTDWPAQITDRIVGYVDTVRTKTTDPAIKIARGIVYGTLAALLGLVLLVLALIGVFRALDRYLPAETWAAHLILGGVFVLLGLFLWSKRTVRTAS